MWMLHTRNLMKIYNIPFIRQPWDALRHDFAPNQGIRQKQVNLPKIALLRDCCYIGGDMGVVRYLTIRMVLSILSIGLLSSQVCNVICFHSDRPASTRGEKPKQSQRTGHCHGEQEQPKEDQQNRSHDCPKHYDIVSIQPDSQITSDLLQQNFIQGWETALTAFSDSPAYSTTGARNSSLFRPHPDQSSHSILRI
jgi:hypothetical protein